MKMRRWWVRWAAAMMVGGAMLAAGGCGRAGSKSPPLERIQAATGELRTQLPAMKTEAAAIGKETAEPVTRVRAGRIVGGADACLTAVGRLDQATVAVGKETADLRTANARLAEGKDRERDKWLVWMGLAVVALGLAIGALLAWRRRLGTGLTVCGAGVAAGLLFFILPDLVQVVRDFLWIVRLAIWAVAAAVVAAAGYGVYRLWKAWRQRGQANSELVRFNEAVKKLLPDGIREQVFGKPMPPPDKGLAGTMQSAVTEHIVAAERELLGGAGAAG